MRVVPRNEAALDVDRDTVRELLSQIGVYPSRRLGQTFLLAEGLARRQVAYVVAPGQRVLEIGPGLGILTEAILEVTDDVVAVEVDPRLCEFLRGRFPGLEVIRGDALRAPLPDFDVVVSNLPYRISSKMTFRLLRRQFRAGALMYQLEFAARLVAAPGAKDYSRLTVHAHHRARVEFMERVPRGRFFPAPRVDSAIVRIVPRPPPYEVVDETVFSTLVDVVFLHRRKVIENALKAHWNLFEARGCRAGGPPPGLPHSRRRPQELFPEELAEVANHIAETKP